MSNNHYNKQYFEERDHLDLHIAESIRLFMREHKLKSLLDIGCGTGRMVKYFNDQGFKALGCDIYDGALKAARKINKKTSIFKASATKLPFKENVFDMIISISVIEHLTPKEAEKFIKEAKRALKPEGYIFLVTPNYSTPIRLLQGKKWFGYSDPTHIKFYTPRTLSNLLKLYKFESIQLQFKTLYDPPYDWEFPGVLGKLPGIVKIALTFLLISTPARVIRNSFWMAAQKQFKT